MGIRGHKDITSTHARRSLQAIKVIETGENVKNVYRSLTVSSTNELLRPILSPKKFAFPPEKEV